MSAASNAHYAAHKQDYLDRNKRRIEEFREVVREHRKQPCFDCGVTHPSYVMQFDHTRGAKKFNVCEVSKAASRQDLLNEIAKCDIVCANCHCVRTHTRKQSVLSGGIGRPSGL